MEYTKTEKMNFYNNLKIEKNRMWMLFLFFGWSYGSMNQMGKQILFYLTFGGLGIWTFYVLFTLNSKIKEYNRAIAKNAEMDSRDLRMLGL